MGLKLDTGREQAFPYENLLLLNPHSLFPSSNLRASHPHQPQLTQFGSNFCAWLKNQHDTPESTHSRTWMIW